MDVTTLFCLVDDQCKLLDAELTARLALDSRKRPGPKPRMSPSEMVTILVLFHQSSYRHFKAFYTQCISLTFAAEFPRRYSYSHFVEMMPRVLFYTWFVLKKLLAQPTGISFMDSTKLEVCHIARAKSNKVFDGLAQTSKTSKVWPNSSTVNSTLGV